MHELFRRRKENLRRLVAECGGPKDFLEQVGHTKGWLSQLIGKTSKRDLSENIAREIEGKVGVAPGLLDAVAENTEQQAQDDGRIAATLNHNLLRLMEQRGINQAELARRARMPVTSVNRVFNALGKNVSPRLETLAGIARGLGVHAAELLMTDPSDPPPVPYEPPFTLARQLSRLVEDFLLSDPADRAELLRLASDSSSKKRP
jgi:transcriptional regulator with XRE-family HTH domain